MEMVGVLPPEDPVYVWVDPAVDVRYADSREGQRVLEGPRYARWPGQWHAEWQPEKHALSGALYTAFGEAARARAARRAA